MESKSLLWYVWESSTADSAASGGGSATFLEVVLKWRAIVTGASVHRETESVVPSAAFEVTSSCRDAQRGAPLSNLPPLCEMCVQ